PATRRGRPPPEPASTEETREVAAPHHLTDGGLPRLSALSQCLIHGIGSCTGRRTRRRQSASDRGRDHAGGKTSPQALRSVTPLTRGQMNGPSFSRLLIVSTICGPSRHWY